MNQTKKIKLRVIKETYIYIYIYIYTLICWVELGQMS